VTSLALAVQTRTFRSLRRHRNYRLFFTGQLVSLAGSWMQNIALAWLVIQLSGSPLAIGILAFCRFLPFTVLGLVSGVVVDRFDTRRLVMTTQAAAMTVSALLAVVTLTGTASLPIVFALAAIGGVAFAFDAPGRQALTFQLVGPSELPNAVALNSGMFNASRIVGPAIAGVVIAGAGTGVCFALNAVSFLAVLAALAAMRVDELHRVERTVPAGVFHDTLEALRYAMHDRQLRIVLLVVALVSTVGFNFNVLVPLLASSTVHVGPRGFGLLSAAFGFGALAGALVTATTHGASWRQLALGAGGFGTVVLLLAPVHSAALAAGLLVAVGVCFTLFTANANALVQLGAPDHLRGRLIGLYLFAFIGLAPLGGLLAGWLADVGGTPLAFAVSGATALLAIALASLRRSRSHDEPTHDLAVS
jgi:MFS family permease